MVVAVVIALISKAYEVEATVRNVSLCLIAFIQVNVDLDYLQYWLVSLQSHYLLFLRSHKDGEGEME